ncbi:SRPBCC family protein [Janthinobacterium sp.]|uniref:SRPBCC family protein n=1 Tax=Janthinobacterium sp. TaxID=1871054 RepID=UPI00293D1CF3|nr:SRPBCC family protein [Janthinobacterium sp.]
MLKKSIIATAVLAAFFLAYVASEPDTFSVQREVTIKASPEKVVVLIQDFRNWRTWSPWEGRDPAMLRSYIGADQGKGAAYAWAGNEQVGAGRMEITELHAARVNIDLDFIRPLQSHNVAEFTLAPQGGSTKVVWRMHGPSPFLAKLTGLFSSMERSVGKDFEAGLANMKAAAEK